MSDGTPVILSDGQKNLSEQNNDKTDQSKKKRPRYSGNWRELGFVRGPDTAKQASTIIVARELVLGLKCYDDVQKLLTFGRLPKDVAVFIQSERHELTTYSIGTLTIYLQLYRKYCITPISIVQAAPPPPPPGDDDQEKPSERNGFKPLMVQAVEQVTKGFVEINLLEEMALLQAERIREGRAKEQGMASGLKLTWIEKNIEVLARTCHTLHNMKGDVGLYFRVPVGVNLSVRNADQAPKFDLLTDGEKKQVYEFGQKFMSFLSSGPASNEVIDVKERLAEMEGQHAG